MEVQSHSSYQNEIPNGKAVPNPCDRTTIWAGVGHSSKSGGGPRNQFGLDFAAAGKVRCAAYCFA